VERKMGGVPWAWSEEGGAIAKGAGQ